MWCSLSNNTAVIGFDGSPTHRDDLRLCFLADYLVMQTIKDQDHHNPKYPQLQINILMFKIGRAHV